MVIKVWWRSSAASIGLFGSDSSCSQFSLVKLTKLPASLNMYIRVRAIMRVGRKGEGGRRRHGGERSLGPMCLREEFVECLGSLVEMCASNKTDGFRDEYSRTIR